MFVCSGELKVVTKKLLFYSSGASTKPYPPGASTSFFLTGCIIFAIETGWIAFGFAADSGLLALINSVINFF